MFELKFCDRHSIHAHEPLGFVEGPTSRDAGYMTPQDGEQIFSCSLCLCRANGDGAGHMTPSIHCGALPFPLSQERSAARHRRSRRGRRRHRSMAASGRPAKQRDRDDEGSGTGEPRRSSREQEFAQSLCKFWIGPIPAAQPLVQIGRCFMFRSGRATR